MNVAKAIDCWMEYHKLHSRKTTLKSYGSSVVRLGRVLGDREVDSLTADDILAFLTDATDGSTPLTKRTWYAHLRSLFNFIKNNVSPDLTNPCDSPMLRKLFRTPKPVPWKILDKEAVDEVIFRTTKPRNRLILELMARGGMRISEVLKLTPEDIEDRKIILREPKSGRGTEVAFVPQKVADRLKEYIQKKRIQRDQRIFPITYTAARMLTAKAGRVAGIRVRPHDLRRHAATYASRSGVPIEIVSKVILRHANLATTQRYLGKVSDVEAIRWIENIHG